MKFPLRESLRSIFRKTAGVEEQDVSHETKEEEAPEYFTLDDFEKQGATNSYFPAPDFGVHPEYNKPVMLPDDNQHRLMYVYKTGGTIDLGDGPKYYSPGDKRVRGRLMGEFTNMVHGATRAAIGNSSASPGEVNIYHRRKAYSAFDRYDPISFAKLDEDTGDLKAPRLSTYVYNSMRPHQMGGGASGQRVVARIAGHKSQTEKSHSDLAKARPIMNAFKLRHSRDISASELAREMGITNAEAKRILVDAAPEYDTTYTIDDANTSGEGMYAMKDAIVSVYVDQDEPKKRIMEWMFPDLLTPKIPVPDNGDATTKNGKVKQKWMAQQLGVQDPQITRWKAPIVDKIKETSANLEQM